MKNVKLLVGCILLMFLGVAIVVLFNTGVGNSNIEDVMPTRAPRAQSVPDTYNGVIKEIIDANRVMVELRRQGEQDGFVEVVYEYIGNFDTQECSNVPISVGDEIWVSVWNDEIKEEDGKTIFEVDEISINPGGLLCSGVLKEIVDDSTLIITDIHIGEEYLGEEIEVKYEKYKVLKGEDDYVELDPKVGDSVSITFTEEDIQKNGDKVILGIQDVWGRYREDVGPEDILFITEYMWLEGEVTEIIDDNTMIVKASLENEHISKGDKVEVKYKFGLEEKIEVPRQVCVGDKVEVCYNSYDVESVDEDKLTALRVEILNDYEYMDGYVLKQKDENSVIAWIEEYDAFMGGYFAIVQYDEYYSTIIETDENKMSHEYGHECGYEMTVTEPKEEDYIRILFDRDNAGKDSKIIMPIKCELVTKVEWK